MAGEWKDRERQERPTEKIRERENTRGVLSETERERQREYRAAGCTAVGCEHLTLSTGWK